MSRAVSRSVLPFADVLTDRVVKGCEALSAWLNNEHGVVVTVEDIYEKFAAEPWPFDQQPEQISPAGRNLDLPRGCTHVYRATTRNVVKGQPCGARCEPGSDLCSAHSRAAARKAIPPRASPVRPVSRVSPVSRPSPVKARSPVPSSFPVPRPVAVVPKEEDEEEQEEEAEEEEPVRGRAPVPRPTTGIGKAAPPKEEEPVRGRDPVPLFVRPTPGKVAPPPVVEEYDEDYDPTQPEEDE